MNCPACSNELTQMTVGDVTVDVCKDGCGGIWFDNFELKKFDEPHESAGEELLDIERNPDVQVDHEQRFNCPKCDGIVMMRHFFSVKHKVQIDECPAETRAVRAGRLIRMFLGCGGELAWRSVYELFSICARNSAIEPKRTVPCGSCASMEPSA